MSYVRLSRYPSGHGHAGATHGTSYRFLLIGSKLNCFFNTCLHTFIVTDIALPELSIVYLFRRFLKIKHSDTGAFLGE